MAKGGKRPQNLSRKPLPSLVKAVVEQDVCAGLLRMNLMDELLPLSILFYSNPYLTPTDLPLARTTIILQWKNRSNSSLLLNLASSRHQQHISSTTCPAPSPKISQGKTTVQDISTKLRFRRRKVTAFQYGFAPEAHQERK